MTGKRLSEGTKRIMLEICTGIALYALAGGLIVMLLPVAKAPALSGFFLGALLSACSMVHITYVTELTMDMNNQREAQKYTVSRYLLRMVVVTACVLIAYFTGYLNMVALFIGLLGIKAGAYLQPLMHRFLEWAVGRRYIKKRGG